MSAPLNNNGTKKRWQPWEIFPVRDLDASKALMPHFITARNNKIPLRMRSLFNQVCACELVKMCSHTHGNNTLLAAITIKFYWFQSRWWWCHLLMFILLPMLMCEPKKGENSQSGEHSFTILYQQKVHNDLTVHGVCVFLHACDSHFWWRLEMRCIACYWWGRTLYISSNGSFLEASFFFIQALCVWREFAINKIAFWIWK